MTGTVALNTVALNTRHSETRHTKSRWKVHRVGCAAAFHHRVGAALFRVADAHPGESVLIACHGGVVDVAFRLFLGLGLAGSFDLWTLNASITEFVRLDGGHRSPGRWRLVRYNDHAHLAGLPAATARRARSGVEPR